LFLILSLGDLALTWILLRYRAGLVYEGNPLAAWCLNSFGWAGVATLKGGGALGVGVISTVLSVRHPQKGGLVLSFGCCVLVCAIAYSGVTALLTGTDSCCPGLPKLWDNSEKLDQRMQLAKDYAAVRARLVEDLVESRCTLADAAATLAQTAWARERFWLEATTRRKPGFPCPESLAAELAGAALDSETGEGRFDALNRRFREQFRSAFGKEPPPFPEP
jgi:hypothetical protein